MINDFTEVIGSVTCSPRQVCQEKDVAVGPLSSFVVGHEIPVAIITWTISLASIDEVGTPLIVDLTVLSRRLKNLDPSRCCFSRL